MTHPYHLQVVNDQINLITLVFVLLAVVAALFLGRQLLRQIGVERDKLRAELPAAIVGELFTRDEFIQLYDRMGKAEIKLEYLEMKQDALLAEAPKRVVEGNG